MALKYLLDGSADSAPESLPWLIGIGMACAGSALAWMIWRQSALARDLHVARVELSGWRDLIDGLQWQSDAAHHLTMVRPPRDAVDTDWAAALDRHQTVWEYFGAEVEAASALRARLGSGVPLDQVMLPCRGGARAAARVELRAVALTDGRGHRAGHVGVASVVREQAAAPIERDLVQTLLQALPIPALLLAGDAASPSRVKGANAAAREWLGDGAAAVVGLSCSELQQRLQPDLRAPLARALAAAAPGSTAPVDGQVRVLRLADPAGADAAGAVAGPTHWLLTVMAAPRAAAAPPSPAAAEHESFSYTVSHDLRAPIRVVEGFTKILKEDYGRQLDRIGNDHLDRVLGAASRMNSMIDALLTLSQLSARPLARQPVNLSQLASYVIEDLRRHSPERTVSVHIAPGLQAQGDPTLVRMVLENLLGNAWKYSAKQRHAEIWLEQGESEGQPVFSVRDNGAGFDMRFADRLFGVFQRLHSATDFPGTGVGLASVRRIVNRHGGEVWAESAVERGSTFHFTLPTLGPAD